MKVFLYMWAGRNRIRVRELTTAEDVQRINNASILSYQGQLYHFIGLDTDQNKDLVINFQLTSGPVATDGWI